MFQPVDPFCLHTLRCKLVSYGNHNVPVGVVTIEYTLNKHVSLKKCVFLMDFVKRAKPGECCSSDWRVQIGDVSGKHGVILVGGTTSICSEHGMEIVAKLHEQTLRYFGNRLDCRENECGFH